jgi:hypothetical protein
VIFPYLALGLLPTYLVVSPEEAQIETTHSFVFLRNSSYTLHSKR